MDRRNAPTDPPASTATPTSQEAASQEAAFAAKVVSVYWNSHAVCPDYVELDNCETTEDLFKQLESYRHDRVQGRLESATVKLVQPPTSGASAPMYSFRINRGQSERTLKMLDHLLRQYSSEETPLLRLTLNVQLVKRINIELNIAEHGTRVAIGVSTEDGVNVVLDRLEQKLAQFGRPARVQKVVLRAATNPGLCFTVAHDDDSTWRACWNRCADFFEDVFLVGEVKLMEA